MSFSAFDIAEQEYKSSNKQAPQQDLSAMDMPVSKSIPSNAFDVAEQISTNKQPDDWWNGVVRDVTRTGSRVVETILGFATGRDLRDLGTSFLENAPEDVVLGSLIDKTIGREAWQKTIQDEKSGKSLYSKIPSQRGFQDISESLTKGYTTPLTKGEEVGDEITKTFTGLMTGGGVRSGVQGATRLPQWAQPIVNFARKLGTSILGESAKEGIKLYGGTPGQQELGKLATLFLTGLTLPRLTGENNPRHYLDSLYQQRDALIPQGTMIQTNGMANRLRNFINNTLRYGGTTDAKRQILDRLEGRDGFLTRLENGTMIMDELLQMYVDMNDNRSGVYAIRDLDRNGVRQLRGYWGEVANILNDGIEGYLGIINPQALQLHQAANSGWAALNQSSHVSDFVMNQANRTALKTGVATLFGGGIFNPTVGLSALGGAGAAAGGMASVDLAMRFMRDPTLRHYYTQVIQNAMRENGPETLRALKKLDDQYSKELKNPKSTLNYPIGLTGE